MATEIRIPSIGIGMTEATISEWMANDGATVQAGVPLYTIEIEKSVNEIEAPATGTLKIIGKVGETYEVGALIATIE